MDNNDINYNIPEEDAPSGKVAKYMDLRVDWAFKYIFSIKRNLLKFLNDILPQDIYDIEYLSNAIPVRSEKDKRSSLDVICESSDGMFLVEMQQEPETDFDDRLAYYTSSLIGRQVKRGDRVYKVNRVYVLCVARFIRHHSPNTPKDKVLFRYEFMETETGEGYQGSRISYFFLELARFRQKDWNKIAEIQERWCYLFKNMHTFADGTPLPRDLHGFDDIVADAKVDGLSNDEKNDYQDAMINAHKLLSVTIAARDEGIVVGRYSGRLEGRKEGRQESKMDIARNMLAKGISADVVSECTGLSVEEVQALAAK